MKKIRIGIVAGEVSGDTLGVKLMQAFKQQGVDVEFEGIGGPQMIAEGMHSFYPMETLSVMGIAEVLRDLRKLFAVRDGLIERWQNNPVDLFIGIDAPDFNLRLSKKIKQLNLPIKTVQYVSPSVWAWRQKRVFSIKKNIDLVMCLFPFECEFYQKYDVPAIFVGHPLAQQLSLADNQSLAREQLNLDQQQRYIALLPGSRRGEIQRLLPILLESIQLLIDKKENESLRFLIPAINLARYEQINLQLSQAPQAVQKRVRVMQSPSAEANIGRLVMEASDVVALASGTATLEAMLLHRPMVVFYKLHWLTYFLVKRLIKIPYFSLPNIISGMPYVTELIQHSANAQQVSEQIQQLLNEKVAQQQIDRHLVLHQALQKEQAENYVDILCKLL